MTRSRWHILKGEPLVLARRLPPRFDVVAETAFPDVPRRRLAHLVRQDLWRALQEIRGFSPVVEIRREAETLWIRAGGRVDVGQIARTSAQARIADLLADPARRDRWRRHAERGRPCWTRAR